jgi:hypothetical protein
VKWFRAAASFREFTVAIFFRMLIRKRAEVNA